MSCMKLNEDLKSKLISLKKKKKETGLRVNLASPLSPFLNKPGFASRDQPNWQPKMNTSMISHFI